ncbi:MAG: LysR family transcriptional regulator [Rhodospirillaceae bacterium]|nr:LysR family transcriptional regulator [Rhodospirillaceae bacterium]RPF96136.1 MAG: LysR family transcriptional regulator [Rhodospirillaceae bacterium TMED63]RZO39118.1 MAG: LysR family transcriptional regulator [Rhodospirillaceae bacterium]
MNPPVPAPRLRILLGREIAIGPGKAELLRLIEEMGSISAAAREMGMSYRRAWTLVETMNGAFREPVVEAAIGGRGGGGAQLTDFGREALNRYRAMEEKAVSSVTAEMDAFSELLDADFAESDE